MTDTTDQTKRVLPLRDARKAFTRSHICAAASELFFETGFATPTMEQIAQAAGIQRSTLYTHFRDKEEILGAITQDYAEALRPVIARLPGPVPSYDQVETWIGEFAAFVKAKRGPTELLVSSGGVPQIPLPIRKFGGDLVDMLAAQSPAFDKARRPADGIAHAWAMTTLRELGWSLCFYAQHGESPAARDRLTVAAVLFTRFVQGEL